MLHKYLKLRHICLKGSTHKRFLIQSWIVQESRIYPARCYPINCQCIKGVLHTIIQIWSKDLARWYNLRNIPYDECIVFYVWRQHWWRSDDSWMFFYLLAIFSIASISSASSFVIGRPKCFSIICKTFMLCDESTMFMAIPFLPNLPVRPIRWR